MLRDRSDATDCQSLPLAQNTVESSSVCVYSPSVAGPRDTETLPESEGSPSAPRRDLATPIVAVGDCLGRYTIRAQIGSGGMGEVYSAHDPELDRLVAIKVLRPTTAQSPEARLRFQREAQAMARLNHPNVVAVYDVGAIADTTFVAMELVEGPTLAAWLAETPRDVRAIVDVFIQAGRGLAAAHSAGITHRDFKPSNVMLGDRVRVVDFGLARPAGATTLDAAAATTPLETTVTGSGRVLGTPAYMAPEQYVSATWSPASDQYSFAVALREALTGVRPGQPGEPRPVPPWLRPILARALQARPEDRFPSMSALLAELSRPRGTWRWVAGSALAIATVSAVAAWRASPPACTGAEERLAGVWDADRKAAVHAAFAATHLPYAEATFERVSAALDRYRSDWLDRHVGSCRATRVEGRQSEALLDLQISCLSRARSLMTALTGVWLDKTDRKVLDAADGAVAGLPAIAECGQDQAHLERLPQPANPVVVANIAAVRAQLDRARALHIAGRWKDAQQLMAPIVAAADATGWLPVRAEAKYLEGQLSEALGVSAAEAQLIEANQLAAAAHDDRVAAEALVTLVDFLAIRAASAQRALLVADLAEAAIARAGNDAKLRSRLLRYRGDAYYTAGKFADARDAFTRARALATQEFGATSDEAVYSLIKLSGVANQVGENAESHRLAEESLSATVARVGPQHPTVAGILVELGTAAYNVHDNEAAADYYTRALAITNATLGADSLSSGMVLTDLGGVEMARGHLPEARTMFERALAIRERALAPEHPLVAAALTNLSTVLQFEGENDRAYALLQHALAIMLKAYGPDHPQVAHALAAIGESLLQKGELEEGLRYHQRAFDIRKQALGAANPLALESLLEVVVALQLLHRCREAYPLLSTIIAGLDQAGADPSNGYDARARCEMADRQPAKAVASMQRAVARCDASSEGDIECAGRYWRLSRALDAVGKRREAVAAATKADQRLASGSTLTKSEIAELRAWLARSR